jgi:hypothetical protein
MESFEHLCKVALEAEGFVVTSNVKFFVRRQTRKSAYAEFQEHGYEVDLVAARGDRLVLAEVKSFFGSRGVNRQSFRGLADEAKKADFSGYKLFNDAQLRVEVVSRAGELYGYPLNQIEMRLYVGKFAGGHEQSIRDHFDSFSEPLVRVVGLKEIVDSLMAVAERKTYKDDPVIMTVKALGAAGRLDQALDKVSQTRIAEDLI